MGELIVHEGGHEGVAQRVRRLQQEARELAKSHVASLAQAMSGVGCLAKEIAEGGEAYPAGVREQARQLVDEMEARTQTLCAISARTV